MTQTHQPCLACSPAGTAYCDGESGDRRKELSAELHRLLAAVEPALAETWDPVDQELLDLAEGDLLAYALRDPAAGGSWRDVLAHHRCFPAVLAYRLAHAMLTSADHAVCPTRARRIAHDLSGRATVRTGVELHPAARIGPRFVVDHGMGTVVGEMTIIGSDCYVLQGVVLGSTRIADNARGQRHPVLGDRVEVGGFARILGPVQVGDGAVIGSHALIRHDIPVGARVSVLHQYQAVVGGTDVGVCGLEAAGADRLRLHGYGFLQPGLRVELVSELGPPSGRLEILQHADDHLVIELDDLRRQKYTHIRLSAPDGTSLTVVIPAPRLASRPAAGGTRR